MSVRVALMQSHDESSVLDFVRQIYLKEYGTQPSSIPETCLIAWDNQKILGVMALEFSTGEPFEIESIFRINFEVLLASREDTVYLGRWISTLPGIGTILAFAGLDFAKRKGKRQALACSKPRVAKYIRDRLGLKMHRFHLEPTRGSVRAEDAMFFLEPPSPFIYFWELEEWHRVLAGKVPHGTVLDF